MNKFSLLLISTTFLLLTITGCNRDRGLLECYKEFQAVSAELEALKDSINREQNSVWTLQRNYTGKIKESDTLRMTSLITNNYLGIDSTISLDLYHITENNDTIKLDESQHILDKRNLRGALYYSISNLNKGKYFLESPIYISEREYAIHYDWIVE